MTRSHARRIGIVIAGWVALVSVVYFAPALRFVRTPDVFRPVVPGWNPLPWRSVLPALMDAALALGAAALLIIGAWGAGRGVSGLLRVRFEDRLADAASSLSLGIGAFGLVGIALAAAGLYQPLILQSLAILGAVATAIVWWRGRPLAGGDAVRIPGERRLEWCVGLFVAGITLLSALAPEVEWDALWFHLYFPRLALETGSLVDVPTEYVSLYPMGWGLWFGSGLAMGGDSVAKLQHWIAMPAGAAMAIALGRAFVPGLPTATAVFALVTIPLVVWCAGTAYIDLGQSLHVACAIYALLQFRREGRRGWVVMAGLQLGAALAAKHLALVVAPLLGVWAIVIGWQRMGSVAAGVRVGVLMALVAVILPLPWYARAWLASGNPVHPEMFSVFGSPPERWNAVTDRGLQDFMDRFGRPRTPANLVTLPWDMTMHAARYGGSLGLLLLLMAPIAAAGRWRARWGTGEGAVLLVTAAFFTLWASPVAAYQMRWLSPVLVLFAVIIALGLHRAERAASDAWGPHGERLARAAFIVLGVMQLPPLTPLQERDRSGWDGWVTHVMHTVPLAGVGLETRASHIARAVPSFAAWDTARRIVPAESTVLALTGGDNYYSVGRYLNPLAPLVRERVFDRRCDPNRASEHLRAMNVRYVMQDRRFLRIHRFGADDDWDDFALTCAATVQTLYTPFFDDGRVVLYEVRGPSRGER